MPVGRDPKSKRDDMSTPRANAVVEKSKTNPQKQLVHGTNKPGWAFPI